MISIKGLQSVFSSYKINSVVLVENESSIDFIISNMENSISLDNWENLENVLKDVYKKNINLLTKEQCLKYLGKDFLNKGVTIL